MIQNSRRNRRVLAGVVGVNLALALAVSAGAVPRLGDGGPVRTAAVSQIEQVAAPAARQPGDTSTTEGQKPSTPTTVAPAPATTAAKPRTTAPPTTKAPAARTTLSTTAPSGTVTTAPPAPAPTRVARRTPTPAEVQGVITELKHQVGGLVALVTIQPAQIDQAGDQVCTAFDNGQTFAQVKSTGLSMIPASIKVAPATADWAVRQAVALYCPGHASKLV